ncbi:DUF3189 family protein [Clostridium pasteurianum]|uniref:DUF3189 family protein n=1 Tax=Clostridium pasteurianum BC1 TaxID=86416 RepID=R4K607_CLOPA|nr:DUF3189 family protein [Clostridium pasteurianum]AGK97993.1 Protein of unknown function (DUF3189) [Clostridium pasteurianum BC1]
MIIIYHDVGGAHSTAIAANLHINRLPMDRLPSKKELLDLPTFDKVEKADLGHLLYIGQDEFGAKVYTLGRKYRPDLVIPAVEDMYSALHGDGEGLYIVDTHPTVNLPMKIGGFTSRQLKWVRFGRPIVTYGSIKAYMDIVNIVKAVKNNLKVGN